MRLLEQFLLLGLGLGLFSGAVLVGDFFVMSALLGLRS